MKPTRENLIAALRSGIATRDELQAHFACDSADLTKPLANLTQHKLADRYLEDGKAAYRLTAKGKKWKPGVVAHGGEAELDAAVAGETDAPVATAEEAKSDEVSTAAEAKPDFARAPEFQYLAPEDYELQPADPALLASANRMLREQLSTQAGTVAAKIAVIDQLRGDLANAQALADKLQHLLDSKTHECEALRKALDELPQAKSVGGWIHGLTVENAGMKIDAEFAPEPDMDTVPLQALLEAVAMFVDEGQTITVHCASHVTVSAFGRDFLCSPAEANGLLDASAQLLRAEAA